MKVCYYCNKKTPDKSLITFTECKHRICDECTFEIGCCWSKHHKEMYTCNICKICEYEKQYNLQLDNKERKIYHEYTLIRRREFVYALPKDEKLKDEIDTVKNILNECENNLNSCYGRIDYNKKYLSKLEEREDTIKKEKPKEMKKKRGRPKKH